MIGAGATRARPGPARPTRERRAHRREPHARRRREGRAQGERRDLAGSRMRERRAVIEQAAAQERPPTASRPGSGCAGRRVGAAESRRSTAPRSSAISSGSAPPAPKRRRARVVAADGERARRGTPGRSARGRRGDRRRAQPRLDARRPLARDGRARPISRRTPTSRTALSESFELEAGEALGLLAGNAYSTGPGRTRDRRRPRPPRVDRRRRGARLRGLPREHGSAARRDRLARPYPGIARDASSACTSCFAGAGSGSPRPRATCRTR